MFAISAVVYCTMHLTKDVLFIKIKMNFYFSSLLFVTQLFDVAICAFCCS